MIDAGSLLIFALALAIAAGTPGPSMAALVGQVLARGIGQVLPFVLGTWVGEAIWITAAVLGLSALAQNFAALFEAIKFAGVAYLLYLAWRMWTAPTDLDATRTQPKGAPLRLFLTGLSVTMGNPKIMIFYMALVPSIIDMTALGALGVIELILTAIAVLAVIGLTWATVAHQARRWLRSPRAIRLSNRIGATAMGGAAIVIATR